MVNILPHQSCIDDLYTTKDLPSSNAMENWLGPVVDWILTEGLRLSNRWIRSLKVGASGYSYVLDAKEGKTLGTLIVQSKSRR